MNKLIYVLSFILIGFTAFSQDKKSFILKTNSLNYLVKTGFNFSTEFETKPKRSVNLTFEKGNNKYNYETEDRNKFVTFAIEKRNYRISNKEENSLSGLFAGPFLKYRYKDKYQVGANGFFRNGGIFKAHFVGIGYAIGYQNYIFKKIAVEAKLGLGIQARLSIKGETDLTPILPDGILGLSIGYKF